MPESTNRVSLVVVLPIRARKLPSRITSSSALSGGGYRAMLFQTGALWRLIRLEGDPAHRAVAAHAGREGQKDR